MSKKFKFKILSLGGVIVRFSSDFVLVRFSSRTQKRLQHFLYCPNRKKMKIGKNAEIFVNYVKSGLLGHSKRQNSAVFQNSNLQFCTEIL